MYVCFTIAHLKYICFSFLHSIENLKIKKDFETQIKELNNFKEDAELNVTKLENQIKELEREKDKLLKELEDTNSVLIVGKF